MLAVLTVDQRDSRDHPDAVPALLTALRPVPTLRPFQRTAGDEVQGVLDDAAAVVEAVGLLLRDGHWWLGLGVGPVDVPLPEETRAGGGPAYVLAREAVTKAKWAPHRLRVVGADPYAAEQLETVLGLWAGLLERRTDRGWEVADVLADGLSHTEAGHRLGISQSAVTQRAQAAAVADERRARLLATQLLSAMLDREEEEEG